MAARPTALLVLVCAVAALAASAGATQFRVGGQSGWSVPAAGSEPYNTWAGRLRFQIGDQLLFVYPKETDSVLLVDAAAYNACNTSSYVARFDDGSTVFTFDRSGPFFFVSGNEANCRANEKLIVVVLADRSGTRTPPAAPPTSSAPLPSPPSSPPAAAPAPATSPSSSPPSGSAAPVPAPVATPTSPPSPAASAPAPAPTTTTPSSQPAPAAQTPSPSTTPTPGGGSSPPPSASANGPAGEGGGSSNSPPPPSAAAPIVAGFVGSLGAFIGYAMLAT
ncbi:early nodulin-like protein 18 [Miscanthus floridulus]|uniref:early nodulin-like protein 18 n=1 Tax=Miscanthus floridulus TaxID=154761 RepID=UPI00345A3F74